MTDRELLELAAKAAGIGPVLCYETRRNCLRIGHRDSYSLWRPLTDDGDALRLAVRLFLKVEINDGSTVVSWNVSEYESAGPVYEYPNAEYDDRHRVKHINHDMATRCAIVRAAAAIGEQKP